MKDQNTIARALNAHKREVQLRRGIESSESGLGSHKTVGGAQNKHIMAALKAGQRKNLELPVPRLDGASSAIDERAFRREIRNVRPAARTELVCAPSCAAIG
jgi:hypothetical protein